MGKTKIRKDNFKLEFYFNEDGLFIIGNSTGLSRLAEELHKAAQSETGYHKHLNFSWDQLIKTKNFIINFDWIKTRINAFGKKRKAYDVTIIKTTNIGQELLGSKQGTRLGTVLE